MIAWSRGDGIDCEEKCGLTVGGTMPYNGCTVKVMPTGKAARKYQVMRLRWVVFTVCKIHLKKAAWAEDGTQWWTVQG